MENFKAILLILAVFFLSLLQSYGQDFDRKGFHLSIGGGPAISHYTIDGNIINPTNNMITYGGNNLLYYASNPLPDAELFPYSSSKVSFNTNFNIGYGFNERFVISYMNRAAFVFDDAIHRVDYAEPYSLVLGVIGLTGIESSYYFSKEIKSVYTSLGVGVSAMRQPFVTGYLNQIGWGLSISGGYQLAKHFATELNFIVLKGNLSSGIENEIEDLSSGIDINENFDAVSVSLSIKYLLF